MVWQRCKKKKNNTPTSSSHIRRWLSSHSAHMKEKGEGSQMKATKKVQIVEEKHGQAGVHATPRDRIWDWDYRRECLCCTALLIMTLWKTGVGGAKVWLNSTLQMHDKHLEAFNLMTWNKSGLALPINSKEMLASHLQMHKWCKRQSQMQKMSHRPVVWCARGPLSFNCCFFVLQWRWRGHPVCTSRLQNWVC